MIINGFIFDLDGTMVDNMTIHHLAWQQKLEALGRAMTLEQVRRDVHGINEEILERLFGDRLTLVERRRISKEKEAAYRQSATDLRLIPGLLQFLKAAKEEGIAMGVATAAPAENVDLILDGHGIRSYFSSVVHAGQVSSGKPDPEVLDVATRQMGLEPPTCLVFEDSPTGAETARRAGCPTVIITTTHQEFEFEHFPNVVGFIDDFTEITVAQALSLPYEVVVNPNEKKQ